MKIAICTPCYGDVTAEYSYSLAKLVAFTTLTKFNFNDDVVIPTIEIFMRTSSVLPQLRNMLVKDALGWGANFLLWLDADHKFPQETLVRLLSHNLPVVGANYPRRIAPHNPTAVGMDGELLPTTETAAKSGELVACMSMGLGCCLVDMTVFDRVHEHALTRSSEGIWPLFAVEMVGDGDQVIGEDVFFFRKLREAGVCLYIDQTISWHIGHVHQQVLTNANVSQLKKAESVPMVQVRFDTSPSEPMRRE